MKSLLSTAAAAATLLGTVAAAAIPSHSAVAYGPGYVHLTPGPDTADACLAINRALRDSLPNGGTVDARDYVGTKPCRSNMFSGVTPDTTATTERAFTLLLGPATFIGHVAQVQPRNVAVYGVWGGGAGCCADPGWSGTKFKLVDTTYHDVTLWQLRNAHNAILNGVSFDCIRAMGCVGILVHSTNSFGAWRNRIENFTIAHAAQGMHIGSGNSGCGETGTVPCDASALIIRNGTIREGLDSANAVTHQPLSISSGIWIDGYNAAQGSIIESVLFQNVHTGIWIEKMEQALRISSIDCGNGSGLIIPYSTCIVVGDVQDLHISDSRNEVVDNDSTYRFLRIQTTAKVNAIVLERNEFTGGLQHADSTYRAVDVNTPAYIVSIGNGGAGRAYLMANDTIKAEVVSIGDRFPYNRNEGTNQHTGWVDATGTNRINRIN